MKQRNFVQKFVQDFNRPQIFVDRKKKSKSIRGLKHKKVAYE
jgi:hypothetical protein